MSRRLLITVIVGIIVTTGTASAQTPGSRFGGRVSWVNAGATSEALGDTGNALKLHSGYGFELDATLPFSDRFGVELSIGASTHRVCVSGGDWGEIDAGKVWLLPVNVIAQYHHPVYGPWDPYIGIGISWVAPFYDVSGELSDAGVEELDLEGGAGVAAQLGVNYQLGNRWYANVDLRYSGTSLEARVRTDEEDFPTVTLDIKPLVVNLGFGYRF
ncbi:MAG: outer membrane beta-barrel protein [Thermoanaerobaculales bacterium]|nr:outer membrane beta-barrel protein [Thermoanaerobaculales bacterium]